MTCYMQHVKKCKLETFKNCIVVPEVARTCQTVQEKVCHLRKRYVSKEISGSIKKLNCNKMIGRHFYH